MPDQPTAIVHEQIPANGMELHVASAGPSDGPPVVLCHGFPELWYSWRHQLAALAQAGYRALAPDLRGYGGSSHPDEVSAYGSDQLTGDLCGLLDHYGYEKAAFAGHDWGAMVVWEMGRLHPERVASICNMSVPYTNASGKPTEIFEAIFAGKFFYMLYFQEVGPAEAEFDSDPRRFVRSLLYSASAQGMADGRGPMPDAPREGTRFMDVLTPAPEVLPAWLDEHDVDVYVEGLSQGGLFGPASLLPEHGRQLGAFQGPAFDALHHADRVRHGRARPRPADDARGHRDDGRGAARLPRHDRGGGRRALGPTGAARGDQRGAAGVPRRNELTRAAR